LKISCAWLSDHVTLPGDLDAQRLAHDITLKTVEVEHTDEVDGDVVLDIDNKSLTNRPDLWGHAGMARELAAIYQLEYRPTELGELPVVATGLVEVTDPALCRRFAAISFDLPAPVETPGWMETRLRRVGDYVGLFLVDLSNYVMYSTGQPCHVYDRDALALPLAVAEGDDESFELLSGVEVDTRGLPVIRDREGSVGLAGVMGGRASGVRPSTVRGLLEVAAFPAMTVRKPSQRVGVRTEASSRYEKAIDTQRVDQAVGLFLAVLRRVVPDVVVHGLQDVIVEATRPTSVTTPRAFLDTRIGERLPDEEITGTLRRLGFEVEIDADAVRTVSPTWRSTGDIALPHDILEEVARIHGYDLLPIANVSVTLRPVRALRRLNVERLVRESATVHAGLQEVVTYPWCTDAALAACGFEAEDTIVFEGAPSPDRSHLRPSLLLNLLESVALNLRHTPAFGLAELGTVFRTSDVTHREPDGSIRGQELELGVVVVHQDGEQAFRRLRAVVEAMKEHGRVVSLELGGDCTEAWADASARVGLVADGVRVGAMGLVRPYVLRALDVPAGVQVGHLSVRVAGLRVHESRDNAFVAVPELPDSWFDLSVLVETRAAWADVESAVLGVDDVTTVEYLGDYRGDYRGTWVPEGRKSLSLRVTLTPTERTFSADDITQRRQAAIAALTASVGASLRSV
jgi:phenylalanyl-tRNA synthetase beta chain